MDLIVEHGAFGEARQRRCKGGAAMTDIVERLRAREYRNGGESDDTPELINPDGPEAADLISEYRGALEKCREHNEFLAKLAAGDRIYEVEKASGKRVRKSLREVIATEAEAAGVFIRAALAATEQGEGL